MSNAATADEFNTPSEIISEAIGVREQNRGRRTFLSETSDVAAGHGSVKLDSADPAAAVFPFVAVGVRGVLTLAGSSSVAAAPQVLGQFSGGGAALVETKVGAGKSYRFAWMPGG